MKQPISQLQLHLIIIRVAVAAGLVGCDPPPPAARPTSVLSSDKEVSQPLFSELPIEGGIPTREGHWPNGNGFLPDMNPGGVALIDFDNDGRLDVLQTCHAPPDDSAAPAPKQLFRQQEDGTFAIVPGAAGLDDAVYGQGVAVGDYDNDGFPDVYFCNYGIDSLYRNRGDGTFTNVTGSAQLPERADWSTAASFFDYDRDGYLDLMVVRYVKYDPALVCEEKGQRIYCSPRHFEGRRATLYHNERNGTFADVSEKAGFTAPGKALGVLCVDLSGDGWPDIFVANDGEANHLWINQRDGTFKEEAYLRGCAVNGMGQTEANMGVAVGDIAGNGRLSVFVTHQRAEKNTLFSPDEGGRFHDASAAARMAVVDLPYTGWGTAFIDFDNRGTLGVAVVNGAISAGQPHPDGNCGPFWNTFAEKNLLFENDGTGKFRDITARGGDFTRHAEVTRGLACGDLDNDGRTDLVTNTIDNILRVYRNVAPTAGNHWLTVRAITGKRDAYGAQLALTAGDRRLVRLALAGYSAGCSNDPRAHFGLGKAITSAVEILWPDGKRERFRVAAVDTQVTVVQGQGEPLP